MADNPLPSNNGGQDPAQDGQAPGGNTNPADNAEAPASGPSVETPKDPQDPANEVPKANEDSQDHAQDGGDSQDPKANEDPKDPANEDNEDSKDNEDNEDGEDISPEEMDALDAKVRKSLSKTRREAANLRDRLKGETVRADRAEIALASGLPHDAVKFLTGETREEMEDNAADLLAMLGYQDRATPSGLPREVGGSLPGTAGPAQPVDLDSIGARIYKN